MPNKTEMPMPKELMDEEQGSGAPLPPELRGDAGAEEQVATEEPATGSTGMAFTVPADAAEIFKGAQKGDKFQAEVADVASDGSVTVNIIG